MKVRIVILIPVLLMFCACSTITDDDETLKATDISRVSEKQQLLTQESTHSSFPAPTLFTPTPAEYTYPETTKETSSQNEFNTDMVSFPNRSKIIEILDTDRIFGINESNIPFIYTVSAEETEYFKPLQENYWDSKLSPDRKKLVCSEKSIAIIDLASGAKEILDLEGIDKENPYAEWESTHWLNNRKLLYNSGYEWFAHSYIYDLESKSFTPVEHGLDGYYNFFNFIPIDECRVLLNLRAHIKKDGTSYYTEGTGFRSELALYDISSGTITKITDNMDGEFYYYIHPRGNTIHLKKVIKDKETLIGISYEIIQLDSGITENVNIDSPDVIYFLDENQYLTSQEEKQSNRITYHYYDKSYEIGDFTYHDIYTMLDNGVGIIVLNEQQIIRFEILKK